MARRRVMAALAALAITFVVPSSHAWARKSARSAPVVTVLNNNTALGGVFVAWWGCRMQPTGGLALVGGWDGTGPSDVETAYGC